VPLEAVAVLVGEGFGPVLVHNLIPVSQIVRKISLVEIVGGVPEDHQTDAVILPLDLAGIGRASLPLVEPQARQPFGVVRDLDDRWVAHRPSFAPFANLI
jgi:hypothetical protein